MSVCVLLPSMATAQIAGQLTASAPVPEGPQGVLGDRGDDFVRSPDTVPIQRPEVFPHLKEYLDC